MAAIHCVRCLRAIEPVRVAARRHSCCRCAIRRDRKDGRAPKRDCLYCGCHGHLWTQCESITSVRDAVMLRARIEFVGPRNVLANRMRFRVYYIPQVWDAEVVLMHTFMPRLTHSKRGITNNPKGNNGR